MQRAVPIVFTLLAVLTAGLSALRQASSPPQAAMAQAAQTLLSTLEPQQLAQVKFPFNGEDRFDWHFIPRERKGLSFQKMTLPQRQAALALLRVALSETGYEKAETIRSLEPVLRELERGGQAPIRDPELYFFMIFGEPTATGTWGWRYEGHHISQNWTIVRGQALASTPQFLGANPADVRQGPLQGTRVLSREEDLARTLVQSLRADQRRAAIVSDTAPRDILTTNQREAAMQEDVGVRYAHLTEAQRQTLWLLIEEYARVQPRELAEARLARIRDRGPDTITFAWMGPTERGAQHYYRIQGRTFLIEYDNTQNDANHIHSVWRDFRGDFGRDVLAAHYEQHHRPAAAQNAP